jgi:hypothetical protein
MTNLADAMTDKIREMNETIIPAYLALARIPEAPMTEITVKMTEITVKIMQAHVQRATESLASGDVAAMLLAWADIKDYRL